MPEANDLALGIMALVAEQERQAIARRTKEALARRAHPSWRALARIQRQAPLGATDQSIGLSTIGD
jgi:DNA invertase Pin-like site-specific DNA recombinase